MDKHSGDTPINRFFGFWAAIFAFLSFGLVVLLFVAFESGLRSSSKDPDDQRRTELDSATRAAQQELVNTWKKNDDGTFEVPVEFALGAMKENFFQPTRSAVPVPGTKAAEEAASAAIEKAGAPEDDTAPEAEAAPEEGATENESAAPEAEGSDGGETPGNQ